MKWPSEITDSVIFTLISKSIITCERNNFKINWTVDLFIWSWWALRSIVWVLILPANFLRGWPFLLGSFAYRCWPFFSFNIYATAFNGIENCAYSIGKTNSLPANAKMESWDDDSIQSAVQVSPDVLASQITLLDFPVFCSIQPDELRSCAWTKKNKSIIAPNVVYFTKRFNQVLFTNILFTCLFV